MRRVEAPTLEEAYEKASQMLECSISELQSEVMQHPSKGLFGLLKKNAIIVAACNKISPKHEEKKETMDLPSVEESVASEIIATVKEEELRKKACR